LLKWLNDTGTDLGLIVEIERLLADAGTLVEEYVLASFIHC